MLLIPVNDGESNNGVVAVCVAGLERSIQATLNSLQLNLLDPLRADSYFVVETIPGREDSTASALAKVPRAVCVNVTSQFLPSLGSPLLAGHTENMTWFHHLAISGLF